MANFFSTDPQQIRRRVNAAFDAARTSSGSLIFPDHKRPGTPGYNLKELLLGEVVQWHREANTAFEAMSPETATGRQLDRWAEFLGKPRSGLRPATGSVLIEAETTGESLERLFGRRALSAGVRLRPAGEDGPVLELIDDVEIPLESQQVAVRVQSEQQGANVRVESGTSLTVEAGELQDVLDATTSGVVAGGSFEETDEQLRYRLVRALVNPTTFEGFRTQLLSHPDVSEARLSEAEYGPGTLGAFVEPAVSLPDYTLRSELEALWQGPGGVFVSFPSYEGLQLQIRVRGDVSERIVTDYVNNLSVGQEVVLNAIETRLQNAGAGDAQVIGIKRGSVDLDTGSLQGARRLQSVTNLTAEESARTKWHTRPDWIQFCG